MKRYALALVLCFAISAGMAQPKIILKLDDLGSRNGVTTAQKTLDVLVQRKIKAGLGVIARGLDTVAMEAYSKYLAATNSKGEKLFEIWNHGFDHSKNNPPGGDSFEFKQTGYLFQKEHIAQSHARVKQLLGVEMHSFGSPFNQSDTVTNRVLGEHGSYHVFLFGDIETGLPKGLKNYNNRVEMEITTGQVSFDHFMADYERQKAKYPTLMVLQGHPNMWDDARIAEFNKILDFLIAQKCEFVLPYEHYLSAK